MARAAFDISLAIAKDRIVAGKPVIEYQAIAHKLADLVADIEAVKWQVYYGAWRVDQGTLDIATVSRVKLMAAKAAVRISEAAIRIHSDALVYVIGEGTSKIQRNIILRDLKG